MYRSLRELYAVFRVQLRMWHALSVLVWLCLGSKCVAPSHFSVYTPLAYFCCLLIYGWAPLWGLWQLRGDTLVKTSKAEDLFWQKLILVALQCGSAEYLCDREKSSRTASLEWRRRTQTNSTCSLRLMLQKNPVCIQCTFYFKSKNVI